MLEILKEITKPQAMYYVRSIGKPAMPITELLLKSHTPIRTVSRCEITDSEQSGVQLGINCN